MTFDIFSTRFPIFCCFFPGHHLFLFELETSKNKQPSFIHKHGLYKRSIEKRRCVCQIGGRLALFSFVLCVACLVRSYLFIKSIFFRSQDSPLMAIDSITHRDAAGDRKPWFAVVDEIDDQVKKPKIYQRKYKPNRARRRKDERVNQFLFSCENHVDRNMRKESNRDFFGQ